MGQSQIYCVSEVRAFAEDNYPVTAYQSVEVSEFPPSGFPHIDSMRTRGDEFRMNRRQVRVYYQAYPHMSDFWCCLRVANYFREFSTGEVRRIHLLETVWKIAEVGSQSSG